MGLRAELINNSEIGYFRVFAKTPRRSPIELTLFRGSPCQVSALEFQDPFGDASASITFPQITVFDRPGYGDLWWYVPYADIDIEWQNIGGASYSWKWEGFIVAENAQFGANNSGVTIECKGALFQLDNYLAAPWFPTRPVPYELLIKDAFNPRKRPGLRTSPLVVRWPRNWDTRVPEWDRAGYLRFLKPWGVHAGQKWTGLTTRQTGGWDPMLTGFVQGLLSVMYDDGGSQWTIKKQRGRLPVLHLREQADFNDPKLLRMQVGDPGIEISFSRDFTQSANVLFGSGSDTRGVMFNGTQISNDGQRTTYRPFAFSPHVHPVRSNPNRTDEVMRKEAHIKFPDGLDEIEAGRVAQAQLQRFADPGLTGTITLNTDPVTVDGEVHPRFLIQAGRSILIEGIRGITEGVLAHVTKTSINITDGTTTLSFDTKYRDELTVSEVRARTLDSLTPLRSLQTGKYSNTVQDLLKPWSYADGSGCIPSGGGRDSTEFFTKILPDNARFPWESWTTRHPPKNPKSKKFYIPVGPADPDDSRNNWAGHPVSQRKKGQPYVRRKAYHVKAAQAATIRLIQIAAYDRNGNVKPVRFHVSFYTSRTGVTQQDMPKIPEANEGIRVRSPYAANYKARVRDSHDSQPHPFFENAWEQTRPDGTQPGLDSQLYLPAGNSGFVIGWGTFYEPAGYSPGHHSKGAQPTGQLVDEASWTFDTTQDSLINVYDKAETRKNKDAGLLYIMIYCDDQGTEPVFFMGRIWRQEPGTS